MTPLVFLLGSIILVQTCQLSGEQGAGRQARRGFNGERQEHPSLALQIAGSWGHMIQNTVTQVEGPVCGSFAQMWTLGWAGTWAYWILLHYN